MGKAKVGVKGIGPRQGFCQSADNSHEMSGLSSFGDKNNKKIKMCCFVVLGLFFFCYSCGL